MALDDHRSKTRRARGYSAQPAGPSALSIEVFMILLGISILAVANPAIKNALDPIRRNSTRSAE